VIVGRNVDVSALSLGTAPLGGLFAHVDDDEATRVVHRALELGLTSIDTAPQYGHGTSERRVGAALAGKERTSFVLSTKVGRLITADPHGDTGLFADAPPSRAEFDFSADGIKRSLDESLNRLGLSSVDIVYLHDPDDHADQAIDEAYPVLDRMRAEGMVGAIGVGMNHPEIPARFVRETDIDVVLIAGRWSLLDRTAGTELLPECARRGVKVVVGGVFNSGLLADPRPGATFDYAPADSRLVARAQRMDAICRDHGVSLTAAALQFPFRHPSVISVLMGVRSVLELESNVAAATTLVPEELWGELDAVLDAVLQP
jgi:D-threo-aldose 1-dehydrogenase